MCNPSIKIALDAIAERGGKVAELAIYETVSYALMEFEAMEAVGDEIYLIDQAKSGVPYVTRFIVFIEREDGAGYDVYIDKDDLGEI